MIPFLHVMLFIYTGIVARTESNLRVLMLGQINAVKRGVTLAREQLWLPVILLL